MPGKRQAILSILRLAVVASIVALVIFLASYHWLDEITAASTGYNASAKGLFGWIEEYQEHDFNAEGVWALKENGTRIKPISLLAEIGTSLALGITIALVSLALVPRTPTTKNNKGEQGEDANAGHAPG